MKSTKFLIPPTLHWSVLVLLTIVTGGLFADLLAYYQWRYVREFDIQAAKKLRPWLIGAILMHLAFTAFVFSLGAVNDGSGYVGAIVLALLPFSMLAVKIRPHVEAMYRAGSVERQVYGPPTISFVYFLYLQFHFGQIARLDRGR